MPRFLLPAAVALVAAILAGCSSPPAPAQAPESSAPVVTAPAITSSPPPAAPTVTASGPARTECELFIPVWQAIESATAGQRPAALPGIVQARAQRWSDELSAAADASTATQASRAMEQAAVFIGLQVPIAQADTVDQSDWENATANLAKALSLCTGADG